MENKKRLIDAKDFHLRVSKKSMSDVFQNWKELPEEVQDAVCKHGQYLRMMLETQPTIDAVEVVHGRWIWDDEEECWICSNCEMSALNNYRGNSADSDYCPTCGAKMDGETP